jgi:hypothetical protein
VRIRLLSTNEETDLLTDEVLSHPRAEHLP